MLVSFVNGPCGRWQREQAQSQAHASVRLLSMPETGCAGGDKTARRTLPHVCMMNDIATALHNCQDRDGASCSESHSYYKPFRYHFARRRRPQYYTDGRTAAPPSGCHFGS